MSYRSLAIIVLVGISVMSSGCWDRRELQERNFIMAAGIDWDAAENEGQSLESYVGGTASGPRFRVSLQVLRPGGSEEKEGRTYVISGRGNSLFAAVRDVLGQSSKALWFEHLQSIIISDAVLRQIPLDACIDFFRRDAEMRWRIKVFVTSGKARELLEYQPGSGEAGGIVFANSVRMHPRTLHIAGARTDLGFLVQDLDSGRDSLVPRIEKAGDSVKIGGVAAFRQNRFVGYLDESIIAGIKFIRGTEKSGIIRAPCPRADGGWVVFEIVQHTTQVHATLAQGIPHFTLQSELIGYLSEIQQCNPTHSVQDAAFTRDVESAVAAEVARYTQYAIGATKTLGVDAANLGQQLAVEQPLYWREHQQDWPQIYPVASFEPLVTIRIQYGGEQK